jgi:hypothetical protein
MNGSPATSTMDLGMVAAMGSSRVARPPASNASGGRSSVTGDSIIVDQSDKRGVQGLTAAAAAFPRQCAYSIRTETDHRNVALPASIAGGILQVGPGWQAEAFYRKVRNFSHGYIIFCGDVECLEGLIAVGIRVQDRCDDVVDVNVRFTLRAISQDRKASWILQQAPNEIEPHAVSLARPYDIAKAKYIAAHAKHVAISADERSLANLLAP